MPVARYESAVINRRVDREVAPGDVHAVLVGRDGSWAAKGVVERFLDVDGFATTATTSLELLVVGRDPAAMARAAARVAEMGGGFAFDGGWSAPLEIDGLISSGTFDTTVAIDSSLSDADERALGIRSTIPSTACCSRRATSCRSCASRRAACWR